MSVNYNDFKNLISLDKIGPVFFIVPNPNHAVGVEDEIKNYHIVCSQNFGIVSRLKQKGVKVFCLNDKNAISSGKILKNAKAIRYIKERSHNKKSCIITSKPSPEIQKLCDNNNFLYLGNDWELNRKIENKIYTANLADKLKIPNAESKILNILENNKNLFLTAKKQNKIVIQLPRGFSGNSTFLIDNEKNLDKIIKKYKGRKVRVSKYIKGKTLTLNVYVGKFGIAIGKPMLQIMNLPFCNRNKFGSCGNDYEYCKNLPKIKRKKLFSYTKKTADYLKKIGYRGILGLDFVADKNSVNLIEINPRFVSSIPMFTKFQIANNDIPFLLLHILDFLEIDINFKLHKESFEEWDSKKIFNASQLILRNPKKHPIKIIKSISSGIYKLKNKKLILQEKSYFTERKLNKDEFFIQCANKNNTVNINVNIEYANIQTGFGIAKSDGGLNKNFYNIVRIILEKIKFEKWRQTI